MGEIKPAIKTKTTSAKVIRLLKPVLGLAASITLVYILISNPINHFLIKGTINSQADATTAVSSDYDSTLSFSSIDDNTIINAISSDEKSSVSEINSDDMLAYLSSGMNEVEIYSEIQK